MPTAIAMTVTEPGSCHAGIVTAAARTASRASPELPGQEVAVILAGIGARVEGRAVACPFRASVA